MKILLIIPTYNEKENITSLLSSISALGRPDLEILVVDDNSPDGTAELVGKKQETQKNIHLLNRRQKDGLGKAYLDGFEWGLKRDYEVLIEMDADFSHNPSYLPEIIDEIKKYDFVVGSRYVYGGGIENWGRMRLFLSAVGNMYARLILNVPIRDLTGGFNAWRGAVLRRIGLDNIKSNGYSFQIELKYRAFKAGFKYRELPIIFHERQAGKSKMNASIVKEALWRIPSLRLKNKH